MMKPKRKDSPITTGSFRLFVRHVPTRSPIGDMASSAPSVKSIIPASKRTAPKRKQSRMLEEMGVLKRVYQYVFTDESGEQVDGESEIIAPEFHGKSGLRKTEKDDEKCCSVSAS